MIDFGLSDEQRDMRALAHDFAHREIRPRAGELDRDGTHPAGIVDAAWRLGLTNLHLPEACGGAGLDRVSGALIVEELGWGCAGVATALIGNDLACAPLLLGGSDELRRRYLGMLAEEPRLAALASQEPDGPDEGRRAPTRAERRGRGWLLTGSKSFVVNGGVASWYVVLVSTRGGAGEHGASAFLVPREAGVSVDARLDTLGGRACDRATISFHDVELPPGSLLGGEGEGAELLARALALTRPARAALAVGLARAALELARDYALERVQFGVPIAEHEAVALMLAGMATKIEASRLLSWRASAASDAGAPDAPLSSMASSVAGSTAIEATTDAVQVFGGYGFVKDGPVEKLMRDAKTLQLELNAWQPGMLATARELLAPGERPSAAA